MVLLDNSFGVGELERLMEWVRQASSCFLILKVIAPLQIVTATEV
jgi:hypothetical protein